MEQKKNTMKPKEIQDLIDYISNTGLASKNQDGGV